MEKILSNIKYVLVVILMILLLVFKDNIYNCFYVITIFCILLGIIYFIEKKEQWILMELFGVDSIMSVIFYKKDVLDFASTITFFISIFLLFSMLFATIKIILSLKNVKKDYQKVVEAEVAEYIENPNSKKKYYKVLYKYKIKKEEYYVESPILLKNNLPEIGSKKTLYLNEKDILDVYFPPPKLKAVLLIGSGVVSIIICLIVVIKLF